MLYLFSLIRTHVSNHFLCLYSCSLPLILFSLCYFVVFCLLCLVLLCFLSVLIEIIPCNSSCAPAFSCAWIFSQYGFCFFVYWITAFLLVSGLWRYFAFGLPDLLFIYKLKYLYFFHHSFIKRYGLYLLRLGVCILGQIPCFIEFTLGKTQQDRAIVSVSVSFILDNFRRNFGVYKRITLNKKQDGDLFFQIHGVFSSRSFLHVANPNMKF